MNHFVGFWQPKYFSTYSSRLCLGETSVYLCFHSNEGCCNMLQRDHFPPISWNWPGHSTMLCRFTLRGRLTGKAEHGHNDGFEGFLGTSLAARLNISEINGRRKTVGPIKLARMVICSIPTYWNLFSPLQTLPAISRQSKSLQPSLGPRTQSQNFKYPLLNMFGLGSWPKSNRCLPWES
jgi:hypothetical protein